jgi:PAS domain S-box-containing protein
MLHYWTVVRSLAIVMFALMAAYDCFVSRVYAAESPAASIPWLKLVSATDCAVAFVFLQLLASGPLALISSAAGSAYAAYCFIAIRRFAALGKAREARWLYAVICAAFLAILNDSAVGSGLYRSIYLTEYAWALSLILMAGLLSFEFALGVEARRSLDRSLSRLRETETQVQVLSRAIKQGPAIVVITDTEGNIEYTSPGFEASAGYSSAEALDKNPRILKSGRTSDAEYKALWETIASGRDWHGEFLNKRKDGGLYWETDSISPIVDEGGVITHYVAVKLDITERKERERELEASIAEKEALLREPAAQEAFAESQRQVRAISLAHEALFRSANMAEVFLPSYLMSVISDLSRFSERPEIGMSVEADPLLLGAGAARLCVEDDGLALGEDSSTGPSSRTGMRLAMSLAEQVGGSLAVGADGTNRVSIESPL